MNLREVVDRIIAEEILLLERKSHFEVLKQNKVPLTDEERKELREIRAAREIRPKLWKD